MSTSSPSIDSAANTHGEDRAIGRLDRMAIALSSLCLVHCIATVALAATLASASAALANPAWHEFGFAFAMLLGAVALGRGYAAHRDRRPLVLGVAGLCLMALGLTMRHGAAEIGCTMVGVMLLAGAHRMNVAGHGHHHRGLASARRRA